MEYNKIEDLWWMSKEEMLSKFVEVLSKIFKDTVGKRKRVFNIELLIRQNFLTLCETPEFMKHLFGKPHVEWRDEEFGVYRFPSRLEDEVIELIMSSLEFVDIGLKEALCQN